ncbi:polyprenyl synthetase family protein [Vagococcus sp. PNs007]|uniref:Polyprenyl synthetase family protein n=1 Tax=Vagococcus proximus TaxID=2991417 RepID=A0ABT5X089_9ENTE|nr:farnesyl diphosphate synthase [Vagococcus proximus]MDF0479415.1 polyprenyl synthetase family protein [Vagococcus proximus]
MTKESFSKEYLPYVMSEITNVLEKNASERTLFESMSYSLEAGGKRLRPLLLLATIDFFGSTLSKGHFQIAGALEMIHTYSLIHDDLPAMDNDELRRGKPTNHIVYGEALAILAGDGLLTEALHLVAISDLSSTQKVWLMTELTKASGSKGMIGGQVGDIEGEKTILTLEELQAVHEKKTGALIHFAVEAGCYLTNQPEAIMAEMMTYADNFGVAFQIKDDLLDVLGDEAEIGKHTGMDEALNKSTYTSLLGVRGAQEALSEHYNKAICALNTVKHQLGKTEEITILEELIQTLMG